MFCDGPCALSCKHRLFLFAVFFVFCGVCDLDTGAQEFKTIEPPPIKRIMMFNSGLAQFFHVGEIEGNCRVEMKFTEADIDNVLKSLVFEDKSAGTVRAVEFKPAPDKQDVAARSLGPPLTLAQTLQKYRGEKIEMTTSKKKLKGSIWSVENRQQGQEFFESVTVVNETGFSTIPLAEVQTIQFEDEKLKDELQLAMVGLAASRTSNLKIIEMLFKGDVKREVRYSYNVDSPIWRMTYRMDLSGDAEKNEAGFQGWAHVDNVTGVDWEDIDLDLRSGRPQSFHVDLFNPVLAIRPSVGLGVFGLPVDRVLNPSLFKSEQFVSGGFGFGGRGGGGGFGGGGGSLGGGGFGGGGQTDDDSFQMDSAIEPVSIPSRPSQLVQFDIPDSVNLKAGRSSMIPVISERAKAKWFSQIDVDSGEPTQFVAQIRNTFSYPLVAGPITLYRDGEFMGDSIIGRIEPGQVKSLIFGKDASVVRLDKESVETTETKIKRVTWIGNKVLVGFEATYTKKIGISNRDSLPRNILLQVDKITEKVEPAADEIVNGKLHFEFACAGGQTIKRTISQMEDDSKEIPLPSVTPTQLKQWRTDGADIDNDLIVRLEKIFSVSDNLKALNEERRLVRDSISSTTTEQKRITDVLKALTTESATQKEYLQQLSENESKLKRLREQVANLGQAANRTNNELYELYSGK